MHQEYVKDACSLCTSDGLSVKGYKGIAFYPALGHPINECNEDGEPESINEGQVVVIMVGDDKKRTIDIEDCEVIPREDFCGECGQIGCNHDGLTRET